MKGKHSKVAIWVFILILVLQLLCMFYYGNAKQGYFVDELWSYGLANSYYHPHVFSNGGFTRGWETGSYFRDYLTVLPNQRFAYGSVFYNQANDFHPPLFYMGLHTVSSFFPNTFSKWYGIVPNIVYFAISMLILFTLAKRLFRNEWVALIPVIVYGFSAGAISNVVYIRMYVLLTVWVMALMDLHAKWIMDNKMPGKDYLLLIVVAYLGFMTHYYFFLVAFFTSAFYFFYLLFNKRIADLLKYCVSMIASLLLVELTFPIAFYKLFSDQRGSEAVQNLFSVSDLFSHAKTFWKIIGQGLFANSINILLLILLIGGGVTFTASGRKKKHDKSEQLDSKTADTVNEEKKRWISILCMLFMTVCYFVLVSKIAPYLSARYLFGIYPVIALIATFMIYEILHYWIPEKIVFAIMLIFASVTVVYGVDGKNVQYLYPEYKDHVNIIQEYEGDTCLYITTDWYMMVQNALELEHMGIVFVESPDNIESLASRINTNKDHMILYVCDTYDQEDILKRVCTTLGFKDWKPLFSTVYNVYELSR
ncbi:hypothetical protein ACK8P7_02240 [Oribacterium sp. P9]